VHSSVSRDSSTPLFSFDHYTSVLCFLKMFEMVNGMTRSPIMSLGLGLVLLPMICSSSDSTYRPWTSDDVAFCVCSSFENVTGTNCECLCPKGKICVRKCCLPHEVLVSGTDHTTKCTRSNDSQQFWNFVVDGGEFTAWKNLSSPELENVHVIYGQPCKKSYYLDPRQNENDSYLLLDNGSLIGEDLSVPDRYCIDYVTNEESQSQTDFSLFPTASVIPYLCDDIDDIGDSRIVILSELQPFKVTAYLKLLCELLSVILLTLTFIVYAVVPSLQNLQGKSSMCHVLSLIVGYSAVFTTSGIIELPNNVCVTAGRLTRLHNHSLKYLI